MLTGYINTIIRTKVNTSTFFYYFILFFTFSLLSGCNLTDNDKAEIITYEYDFRESEESWEPFFTDYNVGWEEKMELTADYRQLPQPLQTNHNAHFISAVNHSDDVKMLFRKQVENLNPGTTYQVGFTVRFATSVPGGCAGIGGAPGEAVKVIASASAIMPEPIIDSHNNDYYLLNVQHLNNSFDWYQNAIMGDIANSRECEEGYRYEIKELSAMPDHTTVTADDNGRAWLMFGTRSGFEGQTDLYYTFFKAEFRVS
jgi:hypothetical protein